MNEELTTGKSFTGEQLDLIKRTVAKETTNDELQLFLYTCRRTGLDPLAKQIYAIKRKGVMAIQTGIDGYRLIADRTGKYAGNDDPIFDSEEVPRRAVVTVYKMVDGVRCGFTSSARWDQYYPGKGTQSFLWDKMPHLMLGKCAEALALRKAFPADLSGIYTHEEMQQAGAAEIDTGKPNGGRTYQLEAQGGGEEKKSPPRASQPQQEASGTILRWQGYIHECKKIPAGKNKAGVSYNEFYVVKLADGNQVHEAMTRDEELYQRVDQWSVEDEVILLVKRDPRGKGDRFQLVGFEDINMIAAE